MAAVATAQAVRTGWVKIIGDWSSAGVPVPVDSTSTAMVPTTQSRDASVSSAKSQAPETPQRSGSQLTSTMETSPAKPSTHSTTSRMLASRASYGGRIGSGPARLGRRAADPARWFAHGNRVGGSWNG